MLHALENFISHNLIYLHQYETARCKIRQTADIFNKVGFLRKVTFNLTCMVRDKKNISYQGVSWLYICGGLIV